ncbi:MAG TPA: hypothetical protein DCE71_00145, partial [Parachlamydiales bacterium]|nr:hypothetical protein [Parachlamydiales bacterium]
MTSSCLRKFLKGFFVLLLCLAGIWFYQLIWGKPTSFNLFAERLMVKKALADPEFLTYLGLTDNTYLDFTSDKLTDVS